jgi:hypothetical protein
MVVRTLLAAGLLLAAAACGRDDARSRELRLLAPAGLVELDHVRRFERASGCRIDLRVYDENENVAAIARRRDVDVVAVPAARQDAHTSIELVRIRLEPGLVIIVPSRFARAFDRPAQPAGRRSVRWTIRDDGESPGCARRWLSYVTSQ